MLTPGFIIKNETLWPLQISLSQIGPLYFDVIMPGQSFVRDTGAVWFTIRASIFLDDKDRITDWDAIWPIGAVVGTVVLAAVTAGAAAYAGGPALAAAGAAGVSGVTGLSAANALAVATAASTLVGAGFSASASLVIGGAVVGGIGSAVTATTTAALKDVFSQANTSVSSAGAYAGPPWPFRREIRELRITGGPAFKQGTKPETVELEAHPLSINTVPPPKAYSFFNVHEATALDEGDASHRFLIAPNRDLFMIRTANSGSGKTEVHVLTAASHYKEFATHAITPLGPCDDNWTFGMGPHRDIYAIKKQHTESGTTEVHILDARTGYKHFQLQLKTALHQTDSSFDFCVAHNGDLVAIRKRGGQSGATEVHVLSYEHRFTKFALQAKTALAPCGDNWSFDIAHNRDIFAFKKNTTESGTCELHILDARHDYAVFALQTPTGLHEVGDNFVMLVAENRDIIAIKRSGSGSGKTEVHALKAPA